MVIPLILIVIMQRVSYAPFSLIPTYFILTKEDITSNFWVLPDKIGWEEKWVQIILYILIIFWV
jgi:hypothetical protein